MQFVIFPKYALLISVGSIMMFPFAFLILTICVFMVFFISLSKGLSTLFFFLKNHLLVLQTSLVAQLVKNPPAMQETWVPSLG